MNFLISLLTARSQRTQFWYGVLFLASALSGLVIAGKMMLELIA